MNEAITERIRRIEDRQAIQDIVAAYGRLVDDRNWEEVEKLYAPDSVFDTVGGRISGRRAVRDYYEQRTNQFGPTYHYPHSHEVFFDSADTAHGIVCAHAELAINGDTVWIALRYLDQYVRVSEGWCFKERRVQFLYVLPLRELPTRMADKLRTHWPETEARLADIGGHLGL
jgi:hypothetical protein